MIHSHPGGQRCFYYFPGTQVATSDGHSFALQPYPTQSCAATGSYGSAATWWSSSSRSGPPPHDPHQRAGAVVSAATSRLGRVVAPRLERARALLAAAVLARAALSAIR